jgi:phosphinothricin acetyltransferase
MVKPAIRGATAADVPALLAIYNHYVAHTPITFDLEPQTLEQRLAWFEQFSDCGRHRLLVCEDAGAVVGYACSHQFRVKQAYDPTVETSVYCAPSATGRGIGSQLYGALFAALSGEDIHTFVGGVTLPNSASVALHQRFGFEPVGTLRAVGRKFGKFWDVLWLQRVLGPGP